MRKPLLLLLLALAGCQFPQGSAEVLVEWTPDLLPRAAEIHRSLGATVLRSEGTLDLVQVPLDRLSRYRALGALAEPNQTLHPQLVGGFRPLTVLPALPTFQVQALNDPLVLKAGTLGQWWLERVQASAAWGQSTGEKVTVAVIDTGVDTSHPDLRANLLTGKNFVDPERTALPEDDFGHGTHVAGIIGAIANNNEGGAGLAYRARLLPIRVLGTNGGDTFQLVQGIQCAVDSGAKVINMSLGSSQYSQIEEQAVKNAINRGVVVVAAAGNDALAGDPISYPAGIRGVISVAATDYNDQRADFSNYNSLVTLSAPGVDILSTLPQRMGKYGFASGTSMASPIVAGAAALLLSAHPTWGPTQVKEALEETAKDLSREAGTDPGYDPYFGYGLLQAASAVSYAPRSAR